MSHWIDSALDVWIAELTDALLHSANPRRELTAFLLNFETDTYNRALTNVVKNLHGDMAETSRTIGQILALRLSHVASLAAYAESFEDINESIPERRKHFSTPKRQKH